MRSHIESLVEANVELGDSRELAVEGALTQFGNMNTIRREWKRASSMAPPMKADLTTALGLNAAASFTAVIFTSLTLREGNYLCGPATHNDWSVLSFYVLPILAGISTGLFAKRRPMLVTLYSLLLLFLPMTLLTSQMAQVVIHPYPVNMGVLVRANLLWIPLGCASAGIISLIRWLKNGPRRFVVA
jgi:hypothetical protein